MSRIRWILIISIVFLNINCSNAPTNADESIDKVQVKGLVVDVFEGHSIPLIDISVVLNDTTLLTDNQGRFDLGNLEIGKYEVSFISEEHEPLDTLIEVIDTTSLELDIFMHPKYYDFVPLFIGSEWKYGLTESLNNSLYYDAMQTIKVLGVEEFENSFKYEMEYVFEGFYIENEDSVDFYRHATYSLIEEKKTSNLSASDFLAQGEAPDTYASILPYRDNVKVVLIWEVESGQNWSEYDMRRYFPQSRTNRELTSPYEFFTIKADSGLVSYSYSWSGNTTSGNFKQDLISFTKGQPN